MLGKEVMNRIRIRAKSGGFGLPVSLLSHPLMISIGLENRNRGKNLHLRPTSMVWGCSPESVSDLIGISFEGDNPDVGTIFLCDAPPVGL
ncbi:hypothetical protein HPP92_012691 [Vanilla planifolia]|uniref:Uncharacterized protein n=1 Tax=Vanilla planifolia TaxID=51239 RepID=A0A835QM09_VANPL|nr:hypothetical protein HPP92_012691 [Vanilla planifolia]